MIKAGFESTQSADRVGNPNLVERLACVSCSVLDLPPGWGGTWEEATGRD